MALPPLSPEQRVKPHRFELRLSLIFAAIFFPLGVHLPYFPLWLEAKGFNSEQIGVMLAAPMFLRIVTTPLITAMADRANDRANVLMALVASSFVLSLGYFLTPVYAIVLAVSLALQIVWSAQSPLADSLALSGVRRFGSVYPAMRIWGSVAFLSASLLGGFILGATSAEAVPFIITAGLAFTLTASLLAPRLGRPRVASPLSAAGIQSTGPKLLHGYFLLIVAGVGVINSSHGFLFGFVSIYWKSIGLSDTVVGLLWAFAVVAEVGVFLVFTRVFGSVSATGVLLVSGAAAFVRWVAFPLIEPSGLGVAGFMVVQSLHAFSTGLFLIGIQKVIAENVPEERTGAAQGIAFFANSFAMAVVTLLSGPLYGRFGVSGFYVMAGIALLGLVLIGLAARLAPERRIGRPHH
jgi:MFS transporter, PPP family, 3-phenylpropionic acid transporter